MTHAYGDGLADGILGMLLIGLPTISVIIYGAVQGFSTKQRAERAYQRRLDRLAADYIAMGFPPYSSSGADAYDLAKKQLRDEAEAVRREMQL